MLKERIGLIPRYNWDYKASDFAKGLWAIFNPEANGTGAFQKIFGKRPIFTTSGRSALYLILKSLGLPFGSYVGVPLFCCPVVFAAIRQANLIPRFIDINPRDYSLCVTDLTRKRKSLSAIIAVHMFGHPADMDPLLEAAGKVPVIEDCAQSLFSQYKGNLTGFLSDVSFFSFRSGKYISAGEGSAIFSKDPYLETAITEAAESLHDWAFFSELYHVITTYAKATLYKKPWYGTLGYPVGTRLDKKLNLTAKSGFKLAKVAKSDLRIITDRIGTFLTSIKKQRENALYLLKNVEIANAFLPHESSQCWSNYYQFAIRFKHIKQRDLMADYLFRQGIDTAKYLDDVVDTATSEYHYNGDCPVAESCSKTVLVIPNHYTLSDRNLDYIVGRLNKGSHLIRI